jgi:hypothetical protein
MEDFAYCIRLWDSDLGYASETGPDGSKVYKQRLPRCHGEVAMADAVVALAANKAMRTRQRIEFQEGWFRADSADVPDGDTRPKVPVT